MKKYDSYKDSGIEWIGEIPGHWETKKIKYRCYVKARVGWKGLKSDEFLTDGYSYLVTGSDFKNDSVNWKNCYHIDQERYEEDPYIQIQNEDLLITKDGTIGKLAIVKELDKPACLNSGIFVVRSTNKDFSTTFLFWILKSKVFTQFNDSTSYGSTIQHLYQNVFVEFSFPFPHHQEQTAITHYLDRKTVEIDELIADKKRLLERYEEEKTALINQAVTKGINPDVPMKDSGIEWLGEVPAQWEVKRLKYVIKSVTGGGTPSTANPLFWNGHIPWVSAKDMKKNYIFSSEDYITEEAITASATNYIEDERVIIVVRSGILKHTFPVAINKVPISINQDLKAFEPKPNISTEFLFWKLKGQSKDILTFCNKMGATVDSIEMQYLIDFPFSFPSIEEQHLIVSYIKTECARIDAKKAKTEKLIDLLTEYRTALISEVVTGKVKVIE